MADLKEIIDFLKQSSGEQLSPTRVDRMSAPVDERSRSFEETLRRVVGNRTPQRTEPVPSPTRADVIDTASMTPKSDEDLSFRGARDIILKRLILQSPEVFEVILKDRMRKSGGESDKEYEQELLENKTRMNKAYGL